MSSETQGVIERWVARLALLAALSWTVLATMDIDRWHSWWLLVGSVLLIAINSAAVLRTTKRPSGQKHLHTEADDG